MNRKCSRAAICACSLLIVVTFLLTYWPQSPGKQPRTGTKPGPREKERSNRTTENDDADETIFVSIASFRDSECPPTVEDMFAKAKNPRRLFIGVIEQNDPSDPPCMPPAYASCQGAEFCPSDNIRIRRVRPSEARGPTFGRYVAMLMYQGEKYYMMIDSHNRLSTHWDAKLIKMYSLLPSKKAVISAYPNAFETKEQNLDDSAFITYMCKGKWLPHPEGILQLAAYSISKGPPRLQPFAAAGVSLCGRAARQGGALRPVPGLHLRR